MNKHEEAIRAIWELAPDPYMALDSNMVELALKESIRALQTILPTPTPSTKAMELGVK
jgi:hypothetical protein